LFENQSNDLVTAIEKEIQRVAGYDPRIQIADTQVFPQENGILIQIELAIVPSTDAQLLSIFFDQQQRRASYV
jgi:predicted component of type VI protein secretion system